jgi:hypothetical protein
MLCSQRTEKCKSQCKIFKHVFFPKTHKKDFFIINYFKYRSYKVFPKNVCLTEIMVKYNMVKFLWQFFVMFATEGWLSVYGKTRILLGNPDIPIERSHKKKARRLMLWFKRYSSINMVNFAVMLCYVVVATMDMLIYDIRYQFFFKKFSCQDFYLSLKNMFFFFGFLRVYEAKPTSKKKCSLEFKKKIEKNLHLTKLYGTASLLFYLLSSFYLSIL